MGSLQMRTEEVRRERRAWRKEELEEGERELVRDGEKERGRSRKSQQKCDSTVNTDYQRSQHTHANTHTLS